MEAGVKLRARQFPVKRTDPINNMVLQCRNMKCQILNLSGKFLSLCAKYPIATIIAPAINGYEY